MTRLLIDNRCATSAREECPAETSSGERKSVKNRRSHGEEVFFERETHCGSHRTEWVGIEPKVTHFVASPIRGTNYDYRPESRAPLPNRRRDVFRRRRSAASLFLRWIF